MAVAVKALFFDVFGTLVDWRTSIAREAKAMLEPQGYALDWLAFADAWRGEYQGAMDEVRSGRMPFCKLDVLHRRNLELTFCRASASTSLSEERTPRTQSRPGTGSTLGPTCRPGCTASSAATCLAPVSNGNISLMVDLARRNDLAVGRHPRLRDRRRLQAEAARLSRRRRGVRSAAAECMMVAAHTTI